MNWWDVLKIGLPAVLAFFAGRASKTLDRRQEAREAETRRAPAFEVTRINDMRFRLRNVGDADATDLTIDFGAYPQSLTTEVPRHISLAVGHTVEFVVAEVDQYVVPAQVLVRCAEAKYPTAVALP
jgi:hypothetical protein